VGKPSAAEVFNSLDVIETPGEGGPVYHYRHPETPRGDR
jgi:hypothetical protein